MADKHDALQRLITMSRSLGQPEKDYVILGEGNTSARIDEAIFWVKASGARLHEIEADGFVEVAFNEILAMLDGGDLSDLLAYFG